MALTTSTITGRVPLPTDEPLQYAELNFTLSGLDTEGAIVLPGGVNKRVVLIDSDIPAGFDIWQNTAGLRGTHYRVLARWTAKSRDGLRDQYADLGVIQVGADASYALADLINSGVPQAPASYWTALTKAEYDAAIQAAIDAQNAANSILGLTASASGLGAGVPPTASYDPLTGVMSFGIPKGDKGDNGDGFTGGSYNAGTGIVTFASSDGLGFSTGDLRGADGTGAGDMLAATYDPIISANTAKVTNATHTGDVTGDTVLTIAAGAVTPDKMQGSAPTSAKYYRGDGSWNTPPNTTYTEISEAEIDTGTASTARAISARRLTYAMGKVSVTKATTPQAQAGTGTGIMDATLTKAAITAQATKSAPDYTSSVFTASRDYRGTFAHGLGLKPTRMQLIIECTSADRGFSVGDQVTLSAGTIDLASGHGVQLAADATNIFLGNYYICLRHKTTGSAGAAWVEIAYANWDVKVQAWK